MTKSAILTMAMAAVVVAFTMPEAQAGRSRTPQPACLEAQYGYEIDEVAGTAAIKVVLKNTCFPGVDMAGEASLLIDGQEAARAPLGADDTVILQGKVSLDGSHQICVHFEGTQLQIVRHKPVTAPVAFDRCQVLDTP